MKRTGWILVGLLVILTIVSHVMDLDARPQASADEWKTAADAAFEGGDYREAARRYAGVFGMQEPTEDRAVGRAFLALRTARSLLRHSVQLAQEAESGRREWSRYRFRDARLWARIALDLDPKSSYPLAADIARLCLDHPIESLRDGYEAREWLEAFDTLRTAHAQAEHAARDAAWSEELAARLTPRDD